jgi:predicted RNA binding protein YcfA (HicA-like mRNA interferase family)
MTTPPPRIYIEVPITYREMIEVLTKLGYHPEFDGKHNRYVNTKYKSMVIMPVDNLDETMERIDVAITSYRLYLQGVIKEEENLIRKIQKNRLKKSMPVSNKELMLA